MSEINSIPIRILLVEDNPGDARLLRESLMEVDSFRFDLTHVSTLSGGLERLAESVTDVVLLDLSLPDSFGLDSFIQVHAQAPGVPFVVLTGLADETLAIEAVRQGAQDYLVKGQVDPELLIRSIHYAIERKRSDEALHQKTREVAVLEERTRLAREIHDTLAQGFTGIVRQLEAAELALRKKAARSRSSHLCCQEPGHRKPSGGQTIGVGQGPTGSGAALVGGCFRARGPQARGRRSGESLVYRFR